MIWAKCWALAICGSRPTGASLWTSFGETSLDVIEKVGFATRPVCRLTGHSSFFRLGDAVELGHNGEEAPIEALELALGVVIADLPPVHLQEVTCSRQGLANGGRIGAGSGAGHGECGKLVGVSRVLPRQEELALQVWLGDLEIAQGHADIFCVPADA